MSDADDASEPLPRRPRGTGSITRNRERFRASIRVASTTGDSKPKVKYFATYEEADSWLADIISQHRRVANASRTGAAGITTVTELLRQWLMTKYRDNQTHGKPDIKVVQDYDTVCRMYIVPHLGDIKLTKLGGHHIESWQDEISKTVSAKTGKLLSADRKRILWVTLTQSMRWGYHRGFLLTDPTAGISAFRKLDVDVRRKAMDDADYKKLLKYVLANPCNHVEGYCRLRLLLGIQYGRRQGEVLGICWPDVLWKEKAIQIDHRLKPRKWKHGCDPDANGKPSCGKYAAGFCPKKHGGGLTLVDGTKSGTRPKLPIDGMVKYFREHEKAQAAERAKFAAKQATKVAVTATDVPATTKKASAQPDYVFTLPDTQNPYGAGSDNLRFERVLKAAGITKKYHVHQMRHTLATKMASATGGNLLAIQGVLGHKTILTSMLYISDDMKARQKALKQTWQHGMDGLKDAETDDELSEDENNNDVLEPDLGKA